MMNGLDFHKWDGAFGLLIDELNPEWFLGLNLHAQGYRWQ
jgi:hypothetical protein